MAAHGPRTRETGLERYQRARQATRRRRRRKAAVLVAILAMSVAAVAIAATGVLGPTPLACSASSDSTAQTMETWTSDGRAVVRACHEVPSPGENLCAMWVSQVYARALGVYPTGDARDLYEQLPSSSEDPLEPGMVVAVSTHPHTEAGATYGHIGIYVGDGHVMDNVDGAIRTTDLTWWEDHYGASVPVRWGWLTGEGDDQTRSS